ncbi:hypothetical protein ACFU7T_12060 [Streptomyces sp. NPDC057555]|uniref:hypothetical protein n=1 Tax=Streptomyces sp. NPDC057555 TaxID=3346166 RepID=UPI00369402BA
MALRKKPGRHAGSPADAGLWAFVRTHPARVFSVAVSVVALLAVYLPGLVQERQEAILAVLAALLWGGDAVQRCEDAKTRDAKDQERPTPGR